MQRLIANLLTCWMLLLMPGAAALDMARPELLLPACCRIHGAHHCALAGGVTVQHNHGPSWSGPGCPFAHMSRAAILLVPQVPASVSVLPGSFAVAKVTAAKTLLIGSWLAGLPPSRAPPSFA